MDQTEYKCFGGKRKYNALSKNLRAFIDQIPEGSHIHNEYDDENIASSSDYYYDECDIVAYTAPKEDGCDHSQTIENNDGIIICIACGTEIEEFDYSAEWRNYGENDNRSSGDPSRCHRARNVDRNLETFFRDISFEVPDSVRKGVERRYNKIVTSTRRGKNRKAVIAVCLFHTYQDFGEYRTIDYICKKFGLSKGDISAGAKQYYLVFPEDLNTTVKPKNLLKWIFHLIKLDTKHLPRVTFIANYLEDSSVLLKRSTPQSVASAIVYFYLCMYPEYKKGWKKTNYSNTVFLSDITISKLLKEIADVTQVKIDL